MGTREITEILAVISLSGFLNRYSDTLAVVTDDESVDWAQANIADKGWNVGKHTGSEKEQRPKHPTTMARMMSAQGQQETKSSVTE